MSDGSDWPLDLVVRARREELSTDEERQLKQCLRSSPTLRVAHLVGSDFDRVGEVEPGDDQRVQRFVADALRRRTHANRGWTGPRRLVTGLLAAAFLLTGTTAFGWWRGWVRIRFPSFPEATASASECSTTPPVDPPPPARPSRLLGASASAQPEPAAPSADPSSRATPEPDPSLRQQLNKQHPNSAARERSTAAFTPLEPDPVTAEQLFSNANRARRSGQNARAISLFHELQREFPGSAEAQLSRLSLGRVWLAQGRAQLALEQFESYLAGGGPLTEEALLGKARALGALGRSGAERAAWQTLLQRFPNSVYEAQAEQRLRQLDVKAHK